MADGSTATTAAPAHLPNSERPQAAPGRQPDLGGVKSSAELARSREKAGLSHPCTQLTVGGGGLAPRRGLSSAVLVDGSALWHADRHPQRPLPPVRQTN